MQQSVTCPSCSARYGLPASFTATSARCRRCDTVMPLPGAVPGSLAPTPPARSPDTVAAEAEAPADAAAESSFKVAARPRSRVSRAMQPPPAEARREGSRSGRSGRSGRRTTGSSGRRTTGRGRGAPASNQQALYKVCGLLCIVILGALIAFAVNH